MHVGEVEGLTSIRYDIVSLLVIGSEKVFLRHHKKVLNDRRLGLKRLPRSSGSGQGKLQAMMTFLLLVVIRLELQA